MQDLGLVGKALQAQQEFAAAYPNAVFTSGRRSLEEQANAMASNVIFNRLWVAQTYKPSAASQACHAWVIAHPGAKSKSDIAAGLLSVLQQFTDDDLSHLSLHLSGQAFDVQPVGGILGGEMAAFLHELADKYGGVFLEREGGLIRWHVQIRDS